jgi:RimJ/RimL family protein N-acetyltransferase
MTVRIEPLQRVWIEALSISDAVFSERFGYSVTPNWAGFPEVLPQALDAARKNDGDPWGSYLFFDGDVLVGFGGFKGPPRGGAVEIGYAVGPSYQGRGIATTAARLLIERARDGGVDTVIAHTLAQPGPSASVLQRCGFERVAATPDPDGQLDVAVWRWELPVAADSNEREL